MGKWLQRIRGAIGMGVTWAIGWAPVGAVAGFLVASSFGFPLGVVALNYAALFGLLGFVGGTLFSTVLSLAEGSRRFDELSFPRFVAWGAVGGFLIGGLAVISGTIGLSFSVFGAVVTGMSTLLGAGSAAGTLAIARASDDPASSERLLAGDPDAQNTTRGASHGGA